MTEEITVNFDMIKEAENVLKGIVHHTDLQFSQTFSDIFGSPVYLKPENLQKTGSYKIRGAYNKLRTLTAQERENGVLTASAGNHAQGLALAAKMTGIKSTVFMPKTAPLAKMEATKRYGANVISTGNNFDEATKEALEWQKEHGAMFISPFNDDYIIAGQGTVGLEIYNEYPEVENVIVPIGGGGVIAGISLALKTINPKIRITGIQATGSSAMYNSFKEGKLIHLETSNTIADGINVKQPALRTYNIIKKYVDEIITVDDEEITQAMLYLLERAKLVVEPSGAVGVAALINNKIKFKGNTVILISGGNVDIRMINNIVQRGMVKSGRYIKFITTISDSPGSLYKLLGVLYELNASIINIEHDRLKQNLKLGNTEVEISIETINHDHNKQIIQGLTDAGYKVKVL